MKYVFSFKILVFGDALITIEEQNSRIWEGNPKCQDAKMWMNEYLLSSLEKHVLKSPQVKTCLASVSENIWL